MKIDLSPEIRELESGEIGYFYSLQQLEAIQARHWLTMPEEKLPRSSRGGIDPFDTVHKMGDHKTPTRFGI